MRSFPQELVFLLFFGAVLLVQFVLRRLRQRTPPTDLAARPGSMSSTTRESRPGSVSEAESDVDIVSESGPQPEPVSPPWEALRTAAPATPGVPKVRTEAASPSARPAPAQRPARRFSRRSLMGDRRSVQNAIVVAAILQPCHAHHPHDLE